MGYQLFTLLFAIFGSQYKQRLHKEKAGGCCAVRCAGGIKERSSVESMLLLGVASPQQQLLHTIQTINQSINQTQRSSGLRSVPVLKATLAARPSFFSNPLSNPQSKGPL